jgi:hypothetical protein
MTLELAAKIYDAVIHEDDFILPRHRGFQYIVVNNLAGQPEVRLIDLDLADLITKAFEGDS